MSLKHLGKGLQKEFGVDIVKNIKVDPRRSVIPTGSLAFDYALGTGGWVRGYIHGVFGERDVGKSSIIGLNAIRNAQAQGLSAVIVSVEPGFDRKWAEAHGVSTDDDDLLVLEPNTGEEAFALLHKVCICEAAKNHEIGVVLFDSIGAVASAKELEEEGKKRMGGQSGMITDGIKKIAMPVAKNQICLILINQIRDDFRSMYGGKKQPGGHYVEHAEATIVQLKRGKEKLTMKVGGDDITYMQEIVADIRRNKLAQGSGRSAIFNFYNMQIEGKPFGIDLAADVVATGKRVGAVEAKSAWLTLPDGSQHQGVRKVAEYLHDHPLVYELIREKVLEAMEQRGYADPPTVEEFLSDRG